MVQMLVVRAGSTDFDEQGRIKGTLDIPLSEAGQGQVGRLIAELHKTKIDHLYASPCRSAQQTAELLAIDHKLKIKTLEELQNLDHGLWHGKRIDEVRVSQPKVFRQLQDHPETVCPPQGEPVGTALERVRLLITRLLRKHKSGTVAVVVPEPLASFVRVALGQPELGDLWKAECEGGGWQMIDVSPAAAALAS
ncbi:MAG TPA: histidine phosphatase family protein [Pirellulaceae bacterium]|nr:histidine phosphatase family protein [Pirellulaceae bacterium]